MRAAFRKRHGVADLHLYKLDEPLVVAWRRVLAIEVIDDLGQVAGQPLAFGFGHAAPPQQGSAFPDTGQNTLMLPMCALSAPRQRKPLESHDLDTTARVHHTARWRGGRVASRRARGAAGDAGDRVPKRHVTRGIWIIMAGDDGRQIGLLRYMKAIERSPAALTSPASRAFESRSARLNLNGF